MSYQGPVARMREQMELERAALALAGEQLPEMPDFCPIAPRVLRATLLTPWSPIHGRCRPMYLGTDMRGPKWLWVGRARVVNHPSVQGLVQVWTRKAHRAWKSEDHATCTVAACILRGEVTDWYSW